MAVPEPFLGESPAGIDYICRVQLALYPDREALPTELINDVERSTGKAIFRSVVNEVVRPDVVNVLWPKANTRSVNQPQPTALRLLYGNLQPLTAPQAFAPLVVQLPPGISKHGGDPASIAFCEATGLDYVSASPYRVPIARLAAAQASLKD